MIATMGDVYQAEFRKLGSKNKVRKALKVLSALGKSHILRGAVIGAGATVAARGLAGGKAAGNVMSEQYGEGIRKEATRAGVKAGLLSGLRDGRNLAAGAVVGGVIGAGTRLQTEILKDYGRSFGSTRLYKNLSKKTKGRIKGAAKAALSLGIGYQTVKTVVPATGELAKAETPALEAELRRNRGARKWAQQNPANNPAPPSRPRLNPGS